MTLQLSNNTIKGNSTTHVTLKNRCDRILEAKVIHSNAGRRINEIRRKPRMYEGTL